MKRIEIFDSTLRDGAQGEGISFSVSDKLNIVKALDEFGVDYIEAGNPGSNPKDIEFFQQVREPAAQTCEALRLRQHLPQGQSRRRRTQTCCPCWTPDTDVVVIFGKSWDLHVLKVLGTTLEENLRLVTDTVAFFKKHGQGSHLRRGALL